MQASTYETALLAYASYRLAKSDSVDEMLAIACVIRNHVMRCGIEGMTYSRVIEDFFKIRPLRGMPDVSNAAMLHPSTGLLAKIDGIYKDTTPDLTATYQQPRGAMWFSHVVDEEPEGWFQTEILNRQDIHPLVGQFGAQQFYE